MKKLNLNQILDLSKKVAEFAKKNSYTEEELMEMDKYEMSVKTDHPEIKEMPDNLSMFDGKDYDEEDTFPYFQQLVRLEFVIINK